MGLGALSPQNPSFSRERLVVDQDISSGPEQYYAQREALPNTLLQSQDQLLEQGGSRWNSGRTAVKSKGRDLQSQGRWTGCNRLPSLLIPPSQFSSFASNLSPSISGSWQQNPPPWHLHWKLWEHSSSHKMCKRPCPSRLSPYYSF